MTNPYSQGNNPYLQGNNPWIIPKQPEPQSQDPNAAAYGLSIAPLALQLWRMKSEGMFGGGKAAAAGTENLSAFNLQPLDVSGVASDVPGAGMEGLDAFNLAAPAAGEAGTALIGNTSHLAVEGGLAAEGGATAAGAGAGGGAAGAGSSVGAAGFGAYLGPAAAGYAAPGLVEMGWKAVGGKDAMENLGHNLTANLVKNESDASAIRSVGVGAGAGAAVGSVVPVVGTAVGAIVGGAAGLISHFVRKGCIIISACTAPDSYEVNITRRFRDKYMDEETLTGYYALCVFVVPFIHKYPLFKRIVKKALVDRLVDYGEWKLGIKAGRKYLTSGAVKKVFLGLCRHIGQGVDTVLAGQEV